MKQLGDGIHHFLKNKKNPTSRRAYYIQKICDDFFNDEDFEKILWQTREFTPEEIWEIYTRAKQWKKNPPALFWKLIKEKRLEIKKQIRQSNATN